MYYLLQYEGLTRNGRVFDMRGMLPHSEARMRMCVMKVADRGRWTYRDWLQWHFLWKFFPWYAREMRYRGHFCLGQGCMHWFWENAEKKERGYCSAAVSRTQNMMWRRNWGTVLLDSWLLRQRRLETFLNFPRGGLEVCGAVCPRPFRSRFSTRLVEHERVGITIRAAAAANATRR